MNELIEQAKALLEDIKIVLDVTWNEEITNKKITNIIVDGINFFNEDVKSIIDFEKDPLAFKLLKTYCRYAWNNSEEYFIENNLADILKLEKKYGKNKTQSV